MEPLFFIFAELFKSLLFSFLLFRMVQMLSDQLSKRMAYLIHIVNTLSLSASLLTLGKWSCGYVIWVLLCLNFRYCFKPERRQNTKINDYEKDVSEPQILSENPAASDFSNISNVKQRLLEYFEKEKPYLSPFLTIDRVASDIYTNKTYISKIINDEMKMNFREFVNSYRVKEAIRIFSEDEDIAINKLKDLSGFNSYSSFSTAFKQHAGTTPGEWRRDLKGRRE